MQPQLRALDAFNARERLVDWVRSLGGASPPFFFFFLFFLLHTGHGPGALIFGPDHGA